MFYLRSIDHETGNLTYREESWNQNKNLFFVDQPAEVGFSYSRGGQKLRSTTEEAAVDYQAFITLFFETFSDLQGREFHLVR